MPRENHLHEPSAILRYDLQRYPAVGKLLRGPTLVICGLNATKGVGPSGLARSLGRSYIQVQEPGKQHHRATPHYVLTLEPPCHDTFPWPRGFCNRTHLLLDSRPCLLNDNPLKRNETQ